MNQFTRVPITVFLIIALQPVSTIAKVVDADTLAGVPFPRQETGKSQTVIPTLAPSTALASVPAQARAVVGDRRSMTIAELESYKSILAENRERTLPNAAHIDAAKQLLMLLPAGLPIPKPMLSDSGEVGLYWNYSRAFADLVIDKDGHYSLFTRDKDDDARETFVSGLAVADTTTEWLNDQLQVLKGRGMSEGRR